MNAANAIYKDCECNSPWSNKDIAGFLSFGSLKVDEKGLMVEKEPWVPDIIPCLNESLFMKVSFGCFCFLFLGKIA